MLPETLRERPVAAAIESFDADAIVTGRFDREELTLEIAAAKIVSVCGFLKFDQGFVRLSSVAGRA